MKSGEEFRTLTEHIRGVMRGQILDVDAITRQQLETYGKRPLIVFLAELTLANCKIRGTRGNRPEDVLELLEQVRIQKRISRQEWSQRSLVSRAHILELLRANPNPKLVTVVRLAIGLDFPLEIVSQSAESLDDVQVEPPTTHEAHTAANDSPSEQRTEATGSPWGPIGAFGASMAGATLIPQMFRHPGAASIGCGALGAASLGVAVLATDPAVRRASGIVAVGLLAGAAVGGLVTLVRSHRSAQAQGGANAR